MKSNGKIYWYGAGTEILDESDTSGNITSEYMFFGGKRIARRDISSGNIYYYEEDTLGSSRTIVQAGQTSLCYDADFYPFGGELIVTNTCPQNYKFEGKERDTETNNDDFGARYYSSVYGRWLSADWSAVPAPVPYANLANPQTLNLYAMVSDNPESFADLNGHAAQAPFQFIWGCNEDLGGCPDQNSLSTTQQTVNAAGAITSSTQPQANTPQVGTTGPQQAQQPTQTAQQKATPAGLVVLSVTVADTDNAYGVRVEIKYQIVAKGKDKQPITNVPNMEPEEHVTETVNGTMVPLSYGNGWGPLLQPVEGKPQHADDQGRFTDPIVLTVTGKFTASVRQEIRIRIGDKTYPVRTNKFTISSNSPGHGSISNGGDIDAHN
jgi:RHS repeat-associated protein